MARNARWLWNEALSTITGLAWSLLLLYLQTKKLKAGGWFWCPFVYGFATDFLGQGTFWRSP